MEPRALLTSPQPSDGRAERIAYPENPRYRRIRKLSILMDQSIVLPNGYRIGLDPLFGLIPGFGDMATTIVSSYLIYEAARLGLPKRVLVGMVGNIALDTVVGSFPILGDLFDAVWKSNMRNLKLIDKHYHPALPARSGKQIAGWMMLVATFLVVMTGTLFYLLTQLLMAILRALTGH